MDQETKQDFDALINQKNTIASFVLKIDDSLIKKQKIENSAKLLKGKKIKEIILNKKKDFMEKHSNGNKSRD